MGVGQALDTLLEQYADDELRVVAKHFVVHPQLATHPALATCAANEQGKFAQFEHAVWKSSWDDSGPQKRLRREQLSAEAMERLAAELGLDVARFKADMTGQHCKTKLGRHRTEMATLGVNGTPGLFINGKFYVGPRTPEALKAVIDEEIAAANAALAKGIDLADYYDQLIKNGKPRS